MGHWGLTINNIIYFYLFSSILYEWKLLIILDFLNYCWYQYDNYDSKYYSSHKLQLSLFMLLFYEYTEEIKNKCVDLVGQIIVRKYF